MTTPVGSGVERLKKGPATGLAPPVTWAILSVQPAYLRGQILYRVAEMLEGRRDQFVREVADAEGLSKSKAAAQVDAAIDRWVWYAGWTDKIAQVVGGANPVAGPYFNLSSPEPTGVVTVLAPQESSFLGLVCWAGSRLMVQESILDELLDSL